MLKSTCCPELDAYQKLTGGQLSVADTETLLRHLETCDSCAGKIHTLPASDLLIDWLGQIKSSASASDEKQLMPLMERLIQLAKPSASPSVVLPSTLRFSCSGCGKPLRVKAEAAGKKVKCPHCGQVIPAPPVAGTGGSGVAPVGSVGMETVDLASAAGGTSKASPPSETPTLAAGPSGKERELCSFLAPAQMADELGRLGSYRVLQVLGAGGMGVVFRAEDPQLQRAVALKAMLPALAANESARQRFLREARLAASLKHDHVVTIHQVGEDRGAPFLAMEFLDGESLEDRLKREGQLPLAEVLRIGREIADGLEAAHEHGLIHRDIKPANVWLEGKRGRVKILDFGLARSSGEDVHLTQSGAIVGTPAYMPPEQARGEKVDSRCDLYSLGCVLYRLCTGQLPFKGDNTMSLLLALATESPKPVRELNTDIPPALADLIMRLLSKEPSQRPATAGEVAQALQDIAEENPLALAPAAVPPRRRRTLPWAVAAGGLVLAALLTVIIIRLGKPEEGSVTIETVDPNVELVFKNGEGKIIIRDTKDGAEFNLPLGSYQVALQGGKEGLKLETNQFTLKRGERVLVKVTRQEGEKPAAARADLPPPLQIPEPPPLAEWLKGRELLTVSQDGRGQFKTIQAALSALKPHQVVKVLDRGPYRESFRIQYPPDDVGVISESDTVVEITDWETETPGSPQKVGPRVVDAHGFRLHGFVFRYERKENRTAVGFGNVSAGVIEDCVFERTGPPIRKAEPTNEQDLGIFWWKGFQGTRPVHVRRCAFGATLTSGGDHVVVETVPLVVEQCLFRPEKGLWGILYGGRYVAVIRHNVFQTTHGNGIVVGDAQRKALQISNNFIYSRANQIACSVGPNETTIVNNVLVPAFGMIGKPTDLETVRAWHLGHNAFCHAIADALEVPRQSSDILLEPESAFLDPLHPSFARIPSDSPLAKGGAGGAWPSYIGALPPGPAPKDGDWFTRLRQRWGKLSTSEPSPASTSPIDPAWFKQVAALPAEKQVDVVAAKLKERNPGFDGKVSLRKVEEGVVTAIGFSPVHVTDISPVRALVGLEVLECIDWQQRGSLSDLSPLKGMKLAVLNCTGTKVSDLSPLKDMKLTSLSFDGAKVSDLSPLKDMKLTSLSFDGAKVSDLSPLKDMKLTTLSCGGTLVSELTPLKGMRLTYLNCSYTQVSDLSPLKDMNLVSLNCAGTRVSDLSPLKGMAMTGELVLNGLPLTDLSVMKGMPLHRLSLDFNAERDAAILRSIKTLERINHKPVAEFWKEVDAKAANKKP